MNKKLLIGAALLGAGVVAYKVYKKSATPTAPPTPLPNVGTPSGGTTTVQTKGQRVISVGQKALSWAEQLLALRKEAAAKKAAKNPPKFSMTNPTYNA
jgi:hypothetical protein